MSKRWSATVMVPKRVPIVAASVEEAGQVAKDIVDHYDTVNGCRPLLLRIDRREEDDKEGPPPPMAA